MTCLLFSVRMIAELRPPMRAAYRTEDKEHGTCSTTGRPTNRDNDREIVVEYSGSVWH